MKIMKLLVLLMLMGISNSAFAEDKGIGDVAQIEQTLQYYYDGTSKGTPELLELAFDDNATLKSINEGKVSIRQIAAYKSHFKPGKPNGRKARTLSISLNNNAATAKAEIKMGGRIYIDYFLLLKTDKGWRITDKIYTIDG